MIFFTDLFFGCKGFCFRLVCRMCILIVQMTLTFWCKRDVLLLRILENFEGEYSPNCFSTLSHDWYHLKLLPIRILYSWRWRSLLLIGRVKSTGSLSRQNQPLSAASRVPTVLPKWCLWVHLLSVRDKIHCTGKVIGFPHWNTMAMSTSASKLPAITQIAPPGTPIWSQALPTAP